MKSRTDLRKLAAQPITFWCTVRTNAYVAILLPALFLGLAPRGLSQSGEYRSPIPAVVFDGSGIVTASESVAGSGFWLASNRFVTCAHVLERANDRLSVQTQKGKRFRVVSVRYFSPGDDLAVLELDAAHHTWLALADRITLGDAICSVANSEGAEVLKIDCGKIVSEGPRFVEISAPIKPGCSGGPIVLRDGGVVGMSSFITFEAVAMRGDKVIYDKSFDRARRFGVKAALLAEALQASLTRPGIALETARALYVEHKYGRLVIRLYELTSDPFTEALRTKLIFAHRYQKQPITAVGTPKGRLYHEGGQVLEDRFELVGGDPAALRRVIALCHTVPNVIRDLQSQTTASPRLQQLLASMESLSSELGQYAADYLAISGQPGRNSYKLTDVERRRGVLTQKLRALEQQIAMLRIQQKKMETSN